VRVDHVESWISVFAWDGDLVEVVQCEQYRGASRF